MAIVKNILHTCRECNVVALWCTGDTYFCDDHVPRGCSCNWGLKPGIEPIYDSEGVVEINPRDDYEEAKDDKGRLLPCVETCYSEEGFLLMDHEVRELIEEDLQMDADIIQEKLIK